MREQIEKRLVACTLCGGDGAEAVRVSGTKRWGGGVDAALMICRPCFEKHRLPRGRAATMDPGGG